MRVTATTMMVVGLMTGAFGCSSSSGGSATGGGGTGGGGAAGDGPGDSGAAGADGGGMGGGSDGGIDAGGDGDAGNGPPLTDIEWTLIRTLSPLPGAPPADTTNRFADNGAAASLGQRLFFEKAVSGPLAVADDGINGGLGAIGDAGKISCAGCHLGSALDDRRSNPNNVSLGADFLTRNALPLVNASFYTWTNWAGRFSAQWELPLGVVENAKNMNGDRLRVAHVIFAKYRAEYEAVVGGTLPDAIGTDGARFPATGKPKAAGAADGSWEGMTAEDQTTVNTIFVNYGKLIAAYLRKLVSGDSRFDRFVAGDGGALSAGEVAGLKIFLGKGSCVSCHSGPALTDNKFHNLGVPQIGVHVPAADNGRFADVPPLVASAFNSAGTYSDDRNTGRLDGLTATPSDDLKGLFRTPSLRNVVDSAPYMHAGQIATLEAVVSFYDRIETVTPAVGTRDAALHNLALTVEEKANLVAFLGALTSAPLAGDLLVDRSAP